MRVHRPLAAALAEKRTEAVPPPLVVPRVSENLRSKGALDLSFHRKGGGTAMGRMGQSGCLRARFVRPSSEAEAPCAVLINTSGGLADGDRLDQRIAWGEGCPATVTTQAAEKVYRARYSGSAISTKLDIGPAARAEWLPQETILFDNCRLRRDTQVRLTGDSSYVGVEAVILGRRAMGEAVRQGALQDSMRIWRDNRLIYADTLKIEGRAAELMNEPAIANGASAMAVIIFASRKASEQLVPVRAALEGARGKAAASAWNGLLAVRLLAREGEVLRHDISAVLEVLCEGRPLPRVWRC